MSSATRVKRVKAQRIFDSRGTPTIEILLTLAKGSARVASPSGKSRGKWEVQSYPPGGVDAAVKLVNHRLGPKLRGIDASKQREFDDRIRELDGTDRLTGIGGNTAYALSVAAAFAASNATGVQPFRHVGGRSARTIPLPLGNVLGGGLHALAGSTDIQEFHVLPTGARTIVEAVEANFQVHKSLGRRLSKRFNHALGQGDEGAWAAKLKTEEALTELSTVVRELSGRLGFHIQIGVDMAASSFWNEKDERYVYRTDGRKLRPSDQLAFVSELIERYGLAYVEDPFHEEAFDDFAALRKCTSHALVCGDDLVVTNRDRLKKALSLDSVNAIIIKPNQVGTLSDAKAVSDDASRAGCVTVMSHRSGEVETAEVAQLAVGFACPILKCAVVGGERTAKLNELLRIEGYLGRQAQLARIPV